MRELGYRQRTQTDPRIADFHSDRVQAPTSRIWSSTEASVHNKALSSSYQRRPGYLRAEKTYRKILERFSLGGTPEQRQRVRQIGRAVARQSPLAGMPWTFEVIETPIPNALCSGEGFVLVTTGLLDLGLTDDELAGVLGHEIAHGVRRHVMIYEERFREALEIEVELRDIQQRLVKYQDPREVHSNKHKIQVLRSRLRALMPRREFLHDFLRHKQAYGRVEEEEADVLGMQYAAAAGFDPEGEARALIKLQARSIELFGQALTEGNRTHPPLGRRLEILRIVRDRWRTQQRSTP